MRAFPRRSAWPSRMCSRRGARIIARAASKAVVRKRRHGADAARAGGALAWAKDQGKRERERELKERKRSVKTGKRKAEEEKDEEEQADEGENGRRKDGLIT